MKHGTTPESDEAIDRLRVLRAWTARRLVNEGQTRPRRRRASAKALGLPINKCGK